ncbi:MAG: translocation/assembly module TamB domain-containing protein [Steroidobacteraceae bacterium]
MNRGKLIKGILICAAGLLLAASIAVTWLVRSESGLRTLVDLLDRVSALDVDAVGISGRLNEGVTLTSLVVTSRTLELAATNVKVSMRAYPLLLGELSLPELVIGTLQVKPLGDAPAADEPRFLPRWLRIDIGRLRVGELRVVSNAGSTRVGSIDAGVEISHARVDAVLGSLRSPFGSASGTLRAVAARPLRLRLTVDWQAQQVDGLEGSLQVRGDLDRLTGQLTARGPIEASGDILLESLGPDLSWQLDGNLAYTTAPEGLTQFAGGPLRGRFRASGSLRELALGADLDALPTFPDGLVLTAGLEFQSEALVLKSARLAHPSSGASLDLNGRLPHDDDQPATVTLRWSGVGWPLVNAAHRSESGTLELSGRMPMGWRLETSYSGPGMPAVSVLAEGLVDAQGLTLIEGKATSRAGRAELSGYLGFDASRPWRVEGKLRGIDLSRQFDTLPSRLDADIAWSGLQGPGQALWAAHVARLGGTLGTQPVTGEGWALNGAEGIDLQRFKLTVGPARIGLEGSLREEDELRLTAVIPDLAGFSTRLGGSLTGSLDLQGRLAALHHPRAMTLSLRGRDLRWDEQRAGIFSIDASLDFTNAAFSWLRLRAGGLVVAGQPVPVARLALDGLVGRHDVEFQFGSGDAAVSLTGAGGYAPGAYRLVTTAVSTTSPRARPFALESPAILTVTGSGARLEPTCFTFDPRRLCMQGDWVPARGLAFSASAREFPLESLRLDLPGRPAYAGVFGLDLEIEVPAEGEWLARVEAVVRDGRLTYVAPSGRAEGIGLGVTRLGWETGQRFHRATLSTRETDALSLDGVFSLERRPDEKIMDAPLSGSLRGGTAQLGLVPLFIPEIDRASGTARLDLDFSGTPASPLVNGEIALSAVEADYYPSNLRLRDVNLGLGLSGTGLALTANGRAGEGSFSTTGQLQWERRKLLGQLRFQGQRLRLVDVPETRVDASPNLVLEVNGSKVSVTGEVTVPWARLQPRQLVGAVLSSPDVRLLGETRDEAQAGLQLSARLRLKLGDDVRLEALGLNGQLGGSVLLTSQPDGNTTGTGELEIRGGTFRAYGRELSITRGRLLFAGGPVDDPGLDLRAVRRLPGYEVGVLVRGPLRKPQLTLFSDPSMPQTQIASMLLVGRSLDQLGPGSRQALTASSADVATQGGALLAGQIGRYVGLDEVTLQEDADRDTSLVLGKFLSPRLYVSYGISLTDSINTLKLRYTIGDRWMISAEAGKEAAADIEFVIDR